MNSGKFVFAKLMEHLPLHTFRRCVQRYPSKYPTKTFSHLDQFLCMAFAQLTYRESLRDIETCLRAHQAQLYHLGIRGNIAKSTLADANEQRDCRIYMNFTMNLRSRQPESFMPATALLSNWNKRSTHSIPRPLTGC